MKKETAAPLTLPLLVLLTLSPLSAASDGFGIEKCRQECRQYPLYDQGMRRSCELECEQREGGGVGRSKYEERERHEWQEGGNPYIFGKESFEDYVRSEHGRAKVLKKFSDLSPLLRGIANYRLLVLEADPHTFVMPKHLDADCVLYVANGEGAIFILHEKSRESHSLRQGDIIRVWAGSIIYLINKSNNQKLKIAKFLNPVGNPGQFEDFFSAGRDEAESYYHAFSTELMEAALNTHRDRLQQFFEKQSGEVIFRAPEEKIRALARQSSKEEEGGPWPFTRSKKPFNLFEKRASHRNQRGQLFEADWKDYEQLRDLDVRVSFANITSGSMMAPFFNTRAVKIAFVLEGDGYAEIICPHLAKEQRRMKEEQWQSKQKREEEERWKTEGKGRYQKVSSRLSTGTVSVVPPGHPAVVVAGREGLQAICFEVQAENNQRMFVAGKNNILNEMEAEAKELAFGVPARVVDEILQAQRDEVFLAGPEERRHERTRDDGGRLGRPLESILEFPAGF